MKTSPEHGSGCFHGGVFGSGEHGGPRQRVSADEKQPATKGKRDLDEQYGL
jgi:hypothetical protein